jgi:hypothetical protein
LTGDGLADVAAVYSTMDMATAVNVGQLVWFRNTGTTGGALSWATGVTITSSLGVANCVVAADVDKYGSEYAPSAPRAWSTICSLALAAFKLGSALPGPNIAFWKLSRSRTPSRLPPPPPPTTVTSDGRYDLVVAATALVWYRNEGGPIPTWTPFTISSSGSSSSRSALSIANFGTSGLPDVS